MGFRFQKRIRIFKGLSLNLTMSGTSWTVGGKGVAINVRGDKFTGNAGISGIGISYCGSMPCCSNPVDQRRVQFLTSSRLNRSDALMCKQGTSTALRTLLLQKRQAGRLVAAAATWAVSRSGLDDPVASVDCILFDVDANSALDSNNLISFSG